MSPAWCRCWVIPFFGCIKRSLHHESLPFYRPHNSINGQELYREWGFRSISMSSYSNNLQSCFTTKMASVGRMIGRLTEIVATLVPLAIVYACLAWIPLAYSTGLMDSLVYHYIENRGACFLKLGQWLSSRPDILPPNICQRLSRLHSKAPTHSLEETYRIIEEELGARPEDLFSYLDPIPIGSGAIGQVYKAVLKGTGPVRYVAVKVMHPGIGRMMETDLRILYFFASVCNYLFPVLQWIGIKEEIRRFESDMTRQLDFRQEANNLSQFRKNFLFFDDVCFPEPIYPFVSKNILVESFEDGDPVSRLFGEGELGDASLSHRKDIAGIGLASFLKMILKDNFTHGDLHPGNIMVRRTKKHPRSKTSKPQVVFLDVGLTCRLSSIKFADFLMLFYLLIVRKDGYEVGRLIIDKRPLFSQAILNTVIDADTFCHKMSGLVDDVFEIQKKSVNFVSLRKVDLICVFSSIFKMAREHHVRLDASFTSIFISLVCLEGIGRQLDKDFDIMPLLHKAGTEYLFKRLQRLSLG